MYSSTIGNSFIWVNTLFQFLSVEEICQELLYSGNTGGTSNEDNLIDFTLLKGSIFQHLLNWFESAAESFLIKIFEPGASNLSVEVLTVKERVNLDGCLGTVG